MTHFIGQKVPCDFKEQNDNNTNNNQSITFQNNKYLQFCFGYLVAL